MKAVWFSAWCLEAAIFSVLVFFSIRPTKSQIAIVAGNHVSLMLQCCEQARSTTVRITPSLWSDLILESGRWAYRPLGSPSVI
jgi:hypothetical protein